MGLERVKNKLWACRTGGACLGIGPGNPYATETSPVDFCPPFVRFSFRSFSAAGKLAIANALYQNRIKLNDELIKVAYTELTCGACDEVCTYLKPLVEVFRALREELVERGVGPPEPNRKVDQNIVDKHNPFGAIPDKRSKWAEEINLPGKGETLYFAGCYASYKYPNTAEATVKILKAAGIDVAYLSDKEWCCGLHAAWDGQRKIEESMAKHNVEAITNAGAKRVIFSCPSCYRTFKKDYPKIVGPLPFEVTHISELLRKLIDERKIKFVKTMNKKVTYHDSCHLGRHLNIYEEPREVIENIPGINLTEMEHNRRWALCCGSGALVVRTAYPKFARWVGLRSLLEAKNVSNTLVTTCPRCIENFKDVARRENINLEILDLPVLVADAMGL